MSDVPPSHLLQSKLAPPGLAAKSLPRTTLLRRLVPPKDMRPVLLEAPAGYGKTTLMEQLLEQQRSAGDNVAWLTLDAYDDTPAELLLYLAQLFRDARLLPATAGELQLQTISPRAALAKLLAEAAVSEHGATLFIDDLHTLGTPDCVALIRNLIVAAERGVRLVMSSRGHSGLDVSKLVVQGKLTRLDGAALAFTELEVAELLGSMCDDATRGELLRKTRGWPVAVRLLQTAAAADPSQLPTWVAHVASVRDVTDYLSEQVLSQLTPDTQAFLMSTSVTDHLTGELANRLSGKGDGWRTLRQLEQDGLFTARDVCDAERYRYYEFFREFLRQRLHESDLDFRALHQRAAEFFLESTQLEDALKHSIEAAEWDLAIRILEQEGGWHLGVQLGSVALQGVQAIPQTLVERSFAARLTLIYLLLHVGQTDTAREKFEQLRNDSGGFTSWQGVTIDRALDTDRRALEAVLLLSEDRTLPVAFVEKIAADARSLGTRGHFVRVLSETNLTIYAYFDAGRYRECIRIAEESLLALQRIKADFGLGYLYIYLGLCHQALGRAQLARGWLDKAFELAAHRFPHEPQRLESIACIAEVQYLQDDLDGARRNIAAVMAGLAEQREMDSAVCHGAYLTAAALEARNGNLDTMRLIFREARSVSKYLQRERRVAAIDIQRIEELARAGCLTEAEEIVRGKEFTGTLDGRNGEPPLRLLSLRASLALARFELASQDGVAVVTRLSNLLLEAEATEYEIVKLKSLTLLTAAQFVAGQLAESMQTLRTLCSRIIPTGLKQLLREERTLLLPVLNHMIERGERVGTAAHVNAQLIVQDWLRTPTEQDPLESPAAIAQATDNLATIGMLSPRQREVLDLLAAGLSGKEIASKLSLSESTIKSYRKTLYVKLRAGRRSQALANARRMLLLGE